DNAQDAPANQLISYDVSNDPSILQAGSFGSGGFDADARGAIVLAVTNMFYAFEDELINTPTNEYTSAFQRAVWGVTYGYRVWGQSGPLTSDVIDTIITNYDSFIQDEPLIEDFLLSALTTPTGDSTVYFGNPTNDPTLQPVMFFPVAAVPEPSAFVFASILGLLFVSRRRRN
ncbi:MAG TPA: PEP-CTERM sorting domain-containing protein, partial [Prosthecobacter sp.]